MSESAVIEFAGARERPATDLVARLSAVALFDGLDEEALDGCGQAFKYVELAPGEILCRQACPHEGLYVLLDGEVKVCRRLPGQRELELARLGAGEVIGEIPLLGGGTHSASVRAVGRCSLLFLSREDFEARTLAGTPCALELRRRIVGIACARLRRNHDAIAAAIGGAPIGGAADTAVHPVQPLPTALPPRAYVSRLPLFRRLEPDVLTALLDHGVALPVPRGHVIQREGMAPDVCYVTLNGAVEDVVRSDSTSVRVGFAGPGHAFGYLGLLDGEAASVASVARERSLLLAIDGEYFSTLQRTRDPRLRAFAAGIEADLIGGLETAGRALSHLAVASPA
jgi:CRP-like cAMP-binding protein